MDQSVSKALDFGISFILFILALSGFLVMHSHLQGLQSTGIIRREAVDVGIIDEPLVREGIEIDELYWLLTEDAFKGNQTNVGIDAAVGSGFVSFYVDGALFPVAVSAKEKSSLVSELRLLTSDAYEVHYVVNDEGSTREVHFTQR